MYIQIEYIHTLQLASAKTSLGNPQDFDSPLATLLCRTGARELVHVPPYKSSEVPNTEIFRYPLVNILYPLWKINENHHF